MKYNLFKTFTYLSKKISIIPFFALFCLTPLMANAADNAVSSSPKSSFQGKETSYRYQVTQFKRGGNRRFGGRKSFGQTKRGNRFGNGRGFKQRFPKPKGTHRSTGRNPQRGVTARNPQGRGTVTIRSTGRNNQAGRGRGRSTGRNAQAGGYVTIKSTSRNAQASRGRGTRRVYSARRNSQASRRRGRSSRRTAYRGRAKASSRSYRKRSKHKRRGHKISRRKIVKLQRRLKRHGFYHGRIDGIMGRLTRRGIRRYKRRFGSTRKLYA